MKKLNLVFLLGCLLLIAAGPATTTAPAEAQARVEAYHQGLELQNAGKLKEAEAKFEAATAEGYDFAPALNHFCWFLSGNADASFRDGKRAVPLGQRAVAAAKATGNDKLISDCLDTLGVAYAETGDFDDAIATEQAALDIAREDRSRSRIDLFGARLTIFQKHEAYHDPQK